jgi:hypothetical protein
VTNAPANVPLFCNYRKAFYVVFFPLVNVNDKFISMSIKLGMVEFMPIQKKSLQDRPLWMTHGTKIKTQNADKII